MGATTYHAWPLPDGTDVPFVHIDMKALADAIDKDIPIVVATKAARDALPPLLNLKVMRKDADYQLEIHNGTGWQIASSGALGMIYLGGTAGASTGLAGTPIMCDLGTVDQIAGRAYKASYTVDINSSGSAASSMAILFDLRKSATTDTTASGTSVASGFTNYTAPVAGGGRTVMAEWNWKATATERVNIKACLQRLTTNSGFDIAQRRLAILDEGKQL